MESIRMAGFILLFWDLIECKSVLFIAVYTLDPTSLHQSIPGRAAVEWSRKNLQVMMRKMRDQNAKKSNAFRPTFFFLVVSILFFLVRIYSHHYHQTRPSIVLLRSVTRFSPSCVFERNEMDSNHTTNHDFSPPPRHLPLGSSSSALQSRSNESSNENRAWSLPVTQDPVDQFSFSKAPSTSKNLPLNRSTVQESSSHTSSDVDSTEDQSRERGDSVRVREKEGSLSSEESEEMELESSIVTPQQGRYRSAQQQQQQQQGGSSIDGRVVGLPTPKSNGGYDQYQINPLNQSMRSMVPGSNVRAPPTFSNVLNHALGGSAAARRPNPSSSNSSHSSSALANPSIHVNSRQNQISSDSISPLDSRMQSQPARAGNVRPVQSNQSPSLSSSNAPGPQQSLRSNQTQGSNSSPRMNPNLANAGGNLLSMGSRMIPTNAARSSTARATTPSGVAREDVGSLDNFFACIPALQKDMAQKVCSLLFFSCMIFRF